MAKLFITRPRLGLWWDQEQCLDVLIDGKPTAPIGLGETIRIDLSPGTHQVNARLAVRGSKLFLVESAPGATHRLAVGPNAGLINLLTWSLILGLLPLFGLWAWVMIDCSFFLSRPANGSIVQAARAWQRALLVPASLLAFMAIQVIQVKSFRGQQFVLIELPDPYLTDEEIAELLRARPFHVRVTIRQSMIAIAILAVCCWISTEVFRSARVSQFESRASFHADLENIFRRREHTLIDSEVGIKKLGLGRGAYSIQKEVAAAMAKADYHAAMRLKYAQAAANRLFSVEPDPNEPP